MGITIASPVESATEGPDRSDARSAGWSDGCQGEVLRMRFGIDMNTDHTLEEVGKQFDVTREQIRQIEAKPALRHPRGLITCEVSGR